MDTRKIFKIFKIFTFISCLFIPAMTYSQSMQVMGGEQSAKNCYMAANIASLTHIASSQDIKECTFALDNTSLRLNDRVATLINRGIIYVALEEFDKAIKDYDRAYKISPDIAEIHVNRGNMLFMNRIFEQAIAEYTRAIELEFSKQHIAYFNRGLTYEKLGEFDNAEADYRRALELYPDWYRARNKLERLLDRTRKG